LKSKFSATKRELRRFGFFAGLFLMAIPGVLIPFLKQQPAPLWPLVVGLLLWAFAFFFTRYLTLLYRPLVAFGFFVSRVNSLLVMGILFYLFLVPAGLISRLAKKDPLDRAWRKDLTTYKVKRKRSLASMEKPFS
jgi:hypothetical protein